MIRFMMTRIKVDQFATLGKQVPTGEIGLTINSNFKGSVEGKAVGVEMSFDFIDKQISERIIVMNLFCEFVIQEEDWNSCIKDDVVTIPSDILEFFALHTVGTARGIMFCKTEGTVFNGVIIPPINVKPLVDGDLIISLKKE